jgi:hypothetical protein
MEGFLMKKARGKGLRLHQWSRRWFVVEDQSLTMYEDFDPENDSPVHQKEVVALADTTVQTINLPDRPKFCFVIKHPHRSELILEAETDALRRSKPLIHVWWMTFISTHLDPRSPQAPEWSWLEDELARGEMS